MAESVPEKQPITASSTEIESGANIEEQIDFLRGLAAIVQEEQLAELSVAHEGWQLTVKAATVAVAGAPATQPVYASPAATAAPSTAGATAPARGQAPDANLLPIVAPMVGVFYRYPSPGDPPFVEVGDRVEIGQVVGLMEAMKVFNDITSEVDGTVAEIRANNGELVETGSPLILIKKA